MQNKLKPSRTNGKVWEPQQLVGALVAAKQLAYGQKRAKCSEPSNWFTKAIGGGIFGGFSNFEKCRPEVADDVVSDVAVD